MVEGDAKEVSEEDLIEALEFAHEEIKRLVAFKRKSASQSGRKKWFRNEDRSGRNRCPGPRNGGKRFAGSGIHPGKIGTGRKINAINERVIEELTETFKEDEDFEAKMKYVNAVLEKIVADEVRRLIIEDHIRPDGRKLDELRPLSSAVDVFTRTHGVALFTRGQTQALAVVTLGALGRLQELKQVPADDLLGTRV